MSIEPGMLVIPKRGLWQEHPTAFYDITDPIIFDKRACKFVRTSEVGVVVQDPLTGEEHEYCNTLDELQEVDEHLKLICEHYRSDQDALYKILCKEDPTTAISIHLSLAKIRKYDNLTWKETDLLNRLEGALERVLPRRCCSVGEYSVGLTRTGERCDPEIRDWVEGEGYPFIKKLITRTAPKL